MIYRGSVSNLPPETVAVFFIRSLSQTNSLLSCTVKKISLIPPEFQSTYLTATLNWFLVARRMNRNAVANFLLSVRYNTLN